MFSGVSIGHLHTEESKETRFLSTTDAKSEFYLDFFLTIMVSYSSSSLISAVLNSGSRYSLTTGSDIIELWSGDSRIF